MTKLKLIKSSSSKLNLPNVRSMKLGEAIGDNPFLRLYGIKKVERLSTPGFEKLASSGTERYLRLQQIRLIKLQKLGDADRFWKVAMNLLRKSKALRMLALRNVKPNWYKELQFERIEKELQRLNGICYRPDDCFEIKRTSLPKPDGTLRWINDPGVAWRCYLWMLNLMVHYWTNPRLFEDQHGHRIGKGSVSCWKQILTKVVKARFIYEFDYMKFHDRINRKYLAEALIRFGFPMEVTQKLLHLSASYVKRTDEKDPLRLQILGDRYLYHHYYRGVIQGSNIAALLALVVLEDLKVYYLKRGKYIGYADDGMLYGDDPNVVQEWLEKLRTPESGVAQKEEKSGWVKWNNEWVKPLSFLGLTYVGSERKVYANTHSGKRDVMAWDREGNVTDTMIKEALDFLRSEGKYTEYSTSDRERFASSKTLTHWNGMPYLGLLTSLVWSGRRGGYMDEKTARDSEFKYSKGSLVDLFYKEGIEQFSQNWNLISASSISYQLLGSIMKANHLLSRRQIKPHKASKPPGTLKVGSGGMMVWMRDEWMALGVSLEMGKDMVPSMSKAPTPVALNGMVDEHDLTEFKQANWFLIKFHGDEASKREMEARMEMARGMVSRIGGAKPGKPGTKGPTVMLASKPARNPNHPITKLITNVMLLVKAYRA